MFALACNCLESLLCQEYKDVFFWSVLQRLRVEVCCLVFSFEPYQFQHTTGKSFCPIPLLGISHQLPEGTAAPKSNDYLIC